jgi:hypothetical protein
MRNDFGQISKLGELNIPDKSDKQVSTLLVPDMEQTKLGISLSY